MAMDGDCLPGQPTLDTWIFMQGIMNGDGTEGSVSWFAHGPTGITAAMAWTSSDSSATWNFYGGTVAAVNLEATLRWAQKQDGSKDITWNTRISKIETHMDTSGESGAARSYFSNWPAEEWALAWEIYWYATGSGSWTSFSPYGLEPTILTW